MAQHIACMKVVRSLCKILVREPESIHTHTRVHVARHRWENKIKI
jgi:hypothetical protein